MVVFCLTVENNMRQNKESSHMSWRDLNEEAQKNRSQTAEALGRRQQGHRKWSEGNSKGEDAQHGHKAGKLCLLYWTQMPPRNAETSLENALE